MRRLYWQVHEPELAAEPDAAAEAIIEQGREVGMLARQLFPGGVEVRSEGGLDQAIRATRELIENREVPAIFEGAFEHRDVFVRVDLLQRRQDNPFNCKIKRGFLFFVCREMPIPLVASLLFEACGHHQWPVHHCLKALFVMQGTKGRHLLGRGKS